MYKIKFLKKKDEKIKKRRDKRKFLICIFASYLFINIPGIRRNKETNREKNVHCIFNFNSGLTFYPPFLKRPFLFVFLFASSVDLLEHKQIGLTSSAQDSTMFFLLNFIISCNYCYFPPNFGCWFSSSILFHVILHKKIFL